VFTARFELNHYLHWSFIFVCKGRAVAWPVSCVPFNAEAWVRYHVHLSKICGGQVVMGQLFLQVLVLPVSIILPVLITHLHLHATCCCYQKAKGTVQKAMLLRKSGSIRYKSTYFFFKGLVVQHQPNKSRSLVRIDTALQNGAVCCNQGFSLSLLWHCLLCLFLA